MRLFQRFRTVHPGVWYLALLLAVAGGFMLALMEMKAERTARLRAEAEAGWIHVDGGMKCLPVKGGWIVEVSVRGGIFDSGERSVTFIPDPEHIWDPRRSREGGRR